MAEHQQPKWSDVDPIEHIKNYYFKKGVKAHEDKVPLLVPTRAALFGLDLRFKEVDEKIRQKRNPFSNREVEPHAKNRHVYPSEDFIQQNQRTERRQQVFTAGTCFDAHIQKELRRAKMPKNVAYLNYKDLDPPRESSSQ